MKEQWKEVEKDMKKRLRARAEHMWKMASKPPTIQEEEEEEGEASGAAANTLTRWASQIPLSENLAIPPSSRNSSLPTPTPPLKSQKSRAPP
jgi:hypothetical protein